MSDYTKTALVLGAGGFIGSHMVKRLKSEGYWVRGVDLKYPEFSISEADEFVQGDLRDMSFVRRVLEFKGDQGNFYNSVPYRYILPFHEIYQFAADMGGAGFRISLARMMPILCTTLPLSISMSLRLSVN
jgi:GDP-D-mannose 3', 5'-epimerase